METDDLGEKIKGLDEFISWIDNFCSDNNIPEPVYDSADSFLLKMDYTKLLELSSEECYANAICLMNYASFLQKKADKIGGHLSWCNEALNFLFSRQWNDYSGSYAPKEVIKKSIISGNSYAEELEKCRIRLQSAHTIVMEQCKDIKKRVNLLQDLGKKRSFS